MDRLTLHRLVLRLYPRDFRARHGAQILAACRHERGGSGPGWASSLADLARQLPGAWLDARDRPRRTHTGRGGWSMGSWGPREWVKEIGWAGRRLRRAPGFTAAAVSTLGLALGVGLAVFALIDAALLRPLPWEASHRLVSINETVRDENISVSWPNYVDWTERVRAFEGLAAYRRVNGNLTGAGPARRLRGLEVTPDLFPLLGVEVARGRGFAPGSAGPDAPREVVLTDALWRDAFAADPGVLGTTARIDGESWAVVGVAPPGFRFPDGLVLGESDFFAPMRPSPGETTDRGNHPGIYVIGRLAAGRSLEEGREEMQAVARELAAVHPENANEGVRVDAALDRVVGDLREALLLLGVAGGLMLLVAAANVSGLLLSRAAERIGEYRLRAALGATRRAIAVPLVAEAVLVALAGAAVGLVLAKAGLEAAERVLVEYPRLGEVTVDARVAVAGVALALVVATLMAILPTLRVGSGRGSGPGVARGHGRTHGSGGRTALVAGQIGVASTLLVVGVALLWGFVGLVGDDGGIRPEGVLTFRVSLPAATYGAPSPAAGGGGGAGAAPGRSASALFTALAERLEALPGVGRASGISTLPFSGFGSQSGMMPGTPGDGGVTEPVRTDVAVVLPGYFDAMGVEVLEGRALDEGDGPGAESVVVVDERFARRFWPGESALGRTVSGWGVPSARVVGVVRHVKNYGVGSESREELFMPHGQRPYVNMNVVVRTDGDPMAVVPHARRILAELDPEVPLASARPMEEVVAGTVAEARLAAALGGGLAAFAAALGLLGLYAMISYTVAGRRREIGVRMALGAKGGQVRRLVVREGLAVAGLGAAAGLALAAVFGRFLAAWTTGVDVFDPAAWAGVVAGVLAVSAVAAWIPARRAAAIDPATSLRESS